MSSHSSQLRCILYDAAGHDRELGLSEVDLERLSKEQLVWVDATGSGDVALPPQMQSAITPPAESGRLEIFDDYYRFGIALQDRPQSCLRFVVGNSWVLTAGDHRPKFFEEFLKAERGETLKGKLSSTAFMASLLMRHLDGSRQEIASVDTAIDKLDETILRSREKRSPLTSLAALRRRLADVRSSLIDQRGVIHGLIAPDFLTHVDASDRESLSEVNRLFEKLEDDVGRARETVIGSFDLYASRVAQDTNQLIKVLTIATVITGVIGAVAGIFGMNFNTPIPSSGLSGFVIVTGAMVIVSLAIVALAFWRKWL